MSLGGALEIGRSGLLASQTAIEVAGNNLANVATRGYHRQVVSQSPVKDQEIQQGVFQGRGVVIDQIRRQVDDALEARVRGGLSDQASAGAKQNTLSQIETLQNELTDSGLSSRLDDFFNSWSQLANNPQDNSVRSVVVQQGQGLVSFIKDMRSGLNDLRTQTDGKIDDAVNSANDLLTRISTLNKQIANSGQAGSGTNTLRDQRDNALADLSQYLDISVVEQPSGSVDVYSGSLPIVLEGKSRGLQVSRQTVNGDLQISVQIAADGSPIQPNSGELGALVDARTNDIGGAIDALDTVAGQLIWQVNRIHSQGQGASGVSTVTGSETVDDPTSALNSTAAGLAFPPAHGSFKISVTQKSTGQRVESTVNINLDGINASSQTSLNSLVTSLNAVSGVSASATPDGRLKVDAAGSDYAISFGDDNSGVLSSLGVNTFFSGGNAADIAINSVVAKDPGAVAVAKGNVVGDNRTALAIAGLRDAPLDAQSPGGLTVNQLWSRHVEDFAVRLGQADSNVSSSAVVTQNLQAQQQAIGGVSTDEEAINLLAYQRAYQGAAKFLTVVDQMMQTLLGIQ
ncbi:MAG: flagellar hook-associated protein FlgK [Planctomycetota bacterium]|nr:flagellar hook-associated protein FlgK [Planctomycetota bacterium]